MAKNFLKLYVLSSIARKGRGRRTGLAGAIDSLVYKALRLGYIPNKPVVDLKTYIYKEVRNYLRKSESAVGSSIAVGKTIPRTGRARIIEIDTEQKVVIAQELISSELIIASFRHKVLLGEVYLYTSRRGKYHIEGVFSGAKFHCRSTESSFGVLIPQYTDLVKKLNPDPNVPLVKNALETVEDNLFDELQSESTLLGSRLFFFSESTAAYIDGNNYIESAFFDNNTIQHSINIGTALNNSTVYDIVLGGDIRIVKYFSETASANGCKIVSFKLLLIDVITANTLVYQHPVTNFNQFPDQDIYYGYLDAMFSVKFETWAFLISDLSVSTTNLAVSIYTGEPDVAFEDNLTDAWTYTLAGNTNISIPYINSAIKFYYYTEGSLVDITNQLVANPELLSTASTTGAARGGTGSSPLKSVGSSPGGARFARMEQSEDGNISLKVHYVFYKQYIRNYVSIVDAAYHPRYVGTARVGYHFMSFTGSITSFITPATGGGIYQLWRPTPADAYYAAKPGPDATEGIHLTNAYRDFWPEDFPDNIHLIYQDASFHGMMGVVMHSGAQKLAGIPLPPETLNQYDLAPSNYFPRKSHIITMLPETEEVNGAKYMLIMAASDFICSSTINNWNSLGIGQQASIFMVPLRPSGIGLRTYLMSFLGTSPSVLSATPFLQKTSYYLPWPVTEGSNILEQKQGFSAGDIICHMTITPDFKLVIIAEVYIRQRHVLAFNPEITGTIACAPRYDHYVNLQSEPRYYEPDNPSIVSLSFRYKEVVALGGVYPDWVSGMAYTRQTIPDFKLVGLDYKD